jgi:hypothetical protein
MTTNFLALVFGSAALLAAPAPGAAQGRPCADRSVVVERLASGYGETRQAMGLAANNAVVEVFASPVSGTWTIVVTLPGGPTCLVASGVAWETFAEALPPDGDGA